MADSGAVGHPEITTVALLHLVLERTRPDLISAIQYHMIHNASIPLCIFPWRISVLTPFELNSKMKITIILFSSNISKPVTAHMQHVTFKNKNIFRIIILSGSIEESMPLSFFIGQE